jgi:3-hydroxymyristoyl/3-hydroxydecanoyl-(acyl carrier protein) dehydratase
MSDRLVLRESLRITVDHPALPGHFPGDPVVPGVVLLDRVAASVEARGHALRRIAAVKFVAPLRPGEDAELVVEIDAPRLRFRVERAGTPILRGEGALA